MKKINLFFTVLFALIVMQNGFAQTSFRGFANTQFDQPLSGKDLNGAPQKNAFGIGQYDNYVTSQLSDRFSFLGEVVFEYDGKTARLDVERVIIKYEWNNAFNVQMGKFHTPLGYWNNAYHHGELLQPTMARPFAVKFEDEGGVMAVHTTGLSITGDNIGKLNFGYDVMVGNGIGSSPVWDNNNSKSVTMNFRIEPIEGIKLGASFYNDFVTANSVTPFREDTVKVGTNQNIFNGYLVIKKSNLEVISEYYKINNKNAMMGTTSHDAFFAYAGYTINKVTPYVQFDYMKYDTKDFMYLNNNKNLTTIGFRYELAPLAVFKAGYRFGNTQLGGDYNGVQAQIAWGF